VGAKTWMLVHANGNVGEALRVGPQLDREGTLQLAKSLFSKDKLEPIGDGGLSYTCPPDDEIHIGCFPVVSILAAKEFGIDYPSKLPAPFFPSEVAERCTYVRCTALLIGLHTRNGSTVSLFDP
jgi:hypothetical protein